MAEVGVAVCLLMVAMEMKTLYYNGEQSVKRVLLIGFQCSYVLGRNVMNASNLLAAIGFHTLCL